MPFITQLFMFWGLCVKSANIPSYPLCVTCQGHGDKNDRFIEKGWHLTLEVINHLQDTRLTKKKWGGERPRALRLHRVSLSSHSANYEQQSLGKAI